MQTLTRDNIKMILLGFTLLLLHQGYAQISVTTVQTGEPVTLTCFFPESEYSNTKIKWYKQSIGDTLTLITTLMTINTKPVFQQGFPSSRFDANCTTNISTLTILRTTQDDKAVYHCAVNTWSKDQWSGTYLSVQGNTQRTSNYTVVQWPTVSDPVHSGDSVTLQCSVLSDTGRKACASEHSVHWFEVRSDKSHANIIYTDGSGPNKCDNKPDARSRPKSCDYHFSKNVSSSDAGTYYCAVVTCGEIIFGNGTKVDIEGTNLWSFAVLQANNIIVLLLCAVLAISLIITAFLIYAIRKNKWHYCNNEAAVSLQKNGSKRNLKRDDDLWIYSTVIFTVRNTSSGGMRDAKAEERERIYAAIKAFGLD